MSRDASCEDNPLYHSSGSKQKKILSLLNNILPKCHHQKKPQIEAQAFE